jgi:hypothetical protein
VKVFTIDPPAVKGNYEYESLWPIGEADWDDFWKFGCTKKAPTWVPDKAIVRVSRVGEQEGDFPYLTGGCLVLGEKALGQLSEGLIEHGELLPLSCIDGRSFAIFHPSPCYDCLDQDLTAGKRFADDRRWMIIERYVFRSDALPSAPIFKIIDMPTRLFCSTAFKTVVETSGLKGLRFREIWNDDADPVETIGWFDRLK